MKPDNPYVGPRAFQDGETLYGRDREVKKLLNLLIAERIVLLYSPSGAGKTSLIQAALVPELREEGFRVFPVIRVGMEPPPDLEHSATTNRYVLSTLLSLEEGLPLEQQTPLEELAGMDLTTYLEQRQAEAGEADGDVLIFDQFEEILTVDPTDQATKAEFFAQLGKALRPRDRWVLFAMREEYPAGLDPYLRPVPTRLSTTFRLELLGAKAARQAMQEPVRQAGVPFTDTAATKLIDDLRRVQIQQPDGTTAERPGLYIEPVQLQVVCYRLWENLPDEATEIRETDIREAGDVDSALAGYYADRVKSTAESTGVRERVIREWFDSQLITEQGIRGQVLRGRKQSQGLENIAIEPLVDAHLVRAENRRGATWYELAHDRLIEPIRSNNATWFQEHLSPLQRQAALWDSQSRPNGLLLRENALVEAEVWADRHDDELIDIERDFLDACREARIQMQRERRKNRFIQGLAIVATIVMCIAIYFFVQARQASRISLTQVLAFQSIFQNQNKENERAALLARQAYLFNQRYQVSMLHQVDNALRTALSTPHFSYILHGHEDIILSVAFSPDGKTLASGSFDKTVRLWDLTNPTAAPTILRGHDDLVYSVAFSPDGRILAVGSLDGTVRLWDLQTPNTASTILRGHDLEVWSVAFSPDGKVLASGSSDRTVRLWDLTNPDKAPTVLRGHKGEVYSLAFSPNEKILASGSGDNTVRLWDLTNPDATPTILHSHEFWVSSVAFSPDGKRLATGSSDNAVRLWDLTTPDSEPTILRSHDFWVSSVAFSPDGKRLASGSFDSTIRLWDLKNLSAAPIVLRGGHDVVQSVAFSQDGQTLASGGRDRTVRLWSFENPIAAPTVLRDYENWIDRVAFSPDGQTLASGHLDTTVRLWNLTIPDVTAIVLRGHEGFISSVAFSPDGKRLASGSSDKTVRLWDLTIPDVTAIVLRGHEGFVSSVAFSPDGQMLASGSRDNTVRLWNLSTSDAAPTILGNHDGRVKSVAFSPDGKRLASGSEDKTVWLWDLTTPDTEPTILRGHEAPVYSVAFSPDGKRLASGSGDKTVRLWDFESLTAAPIILRNHEAQVFSVSFSPDGQTLASGSGDKIRIWMWRTETLAEMVCEKVWRNLTMDEWQQFVSPDIPYERTCSNLPPGEGASPDTN